MKVFKRNIYEDWQDHSRFEHGKWSYWNDCIPYMNSIICFNTVSGATVLLSREQFSFFKDNPDEAPDALKEIGIIVSKDKKEKQEWFTHYLESKNDDSNLDLTIATSMNCQFRCVYCFEGDKAVKSLSDEAISNIKAFVEAKCPTLKKLRVVWFGGEPLLGIPQIRELSAYFIGLSEKYGFSYCSDITTNGFALTEKNRSILFNECRIHWYYITLDGIADIHDQRRPLANGKGTFDVVWSNLIQLVGIGASVLVRVTVDKTNIGSIPLLIDKIASSEIAGKIYLSFVRTMDYSFTPETAKRTIFSVNEFAGEELRLMEYAHMKGLYSYSLPRPCPTGGCLRQGDIVIGTDGEVYKCTDTIGEKQWIIGSIGTPSSNTESQWYKDWLTWTPFSGNNKCRSCKLLPLCNGGCPHNILFTQKKHGTDEQCPDWKYNYQARIRLFIQEQIKNKRYEEV